MCRWSEFEHLNGKQVNHIYREWPIRGCVWWTRSHSCGGGPPGFRTRPPCRDLCSGRRCHPESPTAERSDDSPFPLWSSPGTLWWPITGCRVTQIWSHCRERRFLFDTNLAITLIGSLWTMLMSESQGWGGLDWNSAGRKNEVWTSLSNEIPSSIMWMLLITGTVIPRYLPEINQNSVTPRDLPVSTQYNNHKSVLYGEVSYRLEW